MKVCRKCSNEFSGRDCMICHKAYYVLNAEKVKQRRAEIRAANREEINAKSREWRFKNPDKVRLAKERYALKHSKTIVEKVKQWAEKNPEKVRRNRHNYRAKKRESGKLSHGLVDKLYKLQKGRCACCALPLGEDFHLDHIMPIALGGPNIDSNMQLLRWRCNMQKNAKHPVDFMQQRGYLL